MPTFAGEPVFMAGCCCSQTRTCRGCKGCNGSVDFPRRHDRFCRKGRDNLEADQ